MIKQFFALAIGVGIFLASNSTPVSAISDNVVIAQIQTGGIGKAGEEFISLYNNSASDVDISNWCVAYTDYNDANRAELFCFRASADADQVRIGAQSSALIVSHSYPLPDSAIPTGLFKSSTMSMVSTRGHITLYNAGLTVVDRVAWDSGTSTPPPVEPETLSAKAPAAGWMITRALQDGRFIDTDNNFLDFSTSPSSPLRPSLLIDYTKPVDVINVCPNLEGFYVVMPDGYALDDAGNCELIENDICLNIEFVQTVIPVGKSVDNNNNCYDQSLDVCPGVDGFQLSVPDNYRLIGGQCKVKQPKQNIRITELLPNVAGVDTAKEFIELTNTSASVVDLSDYYLAIGKDAEKRVDIPQVTLTPGAYHAFYNDTLSFSLLNTTSRVELRFYDDTIVDEIVPYQNPNDDIAWALIDGIWQFTNIVTPGSNNRASVLEESALGINDNSEPLSPCPEGKYRNPLTNRCRSIESDVAVLGACEADEYRNPDTNRCRKIASVVTSLAPCQDGYERNPETNRCRKITTDDELVACQEGYERNPETNRCRKTTGTDISQSAQIAAQSVEQTAETVNPYVLGAIAGAGVMGYGVYEWRTELTVVIRRIARLFTRK